MYETEANNKIESSSQIPAAVLSALGELKGEDSGANGSSVERTLYRVCLADLLCNM